MLETINNAPHSMTIGIPKAYACANHWASVPLASTCWCKSINEATKPAAPGDGIP